jgi:hypothetical protein
MHRQTISHTSIDPPITASMQEMNLSVTMIRRHGTKTLMRMQSTFKMIFGGLKMHETPVHAQKHKEVVHVHTTLQSSTTAIYRHVSTAKHSNHSTQAAQI